MLVLKILPQNCSTLGNVLDLCCLKFLLSHEPHWIGLPMPEHSGSIERKVPQSS